MAEWSKAPVRWAQAVEPARGSNPARALVFHANHAPPRDSSWNGPFHSNVAGYFRYSAFAAQRDKTATNKQLTWNITLSRYVMHGIDYHFEQIFNAWNGISLDTIGKSTALIVFF